MGRIEKLLIICFKILFTLLVIVQLLFLVPGMGSRFNIALYLEGEPLKEEAQLYQAGNISLIPWANLTLQLLDYTSRPDVEIEVNGQEIGNFLRKEVSLAVKKGDLITIYNPNENLPIKVLVTKKTPNILIPDLKAMIEGAGRLYFSAVVMK
ncbi:MAG: hypothetical protein PHX01_01305 [Clostridia bacterium]|nr:hypothetical protein [Clostridia bacterium]